RTARSSRSRCEPAGRPGPPRSAARRNRSRAGRSRAAMPAERWRARCPRERAPAPRRPVSRSAASALGYLRRFVSAGGDATMAPATGNPMGMNGQLPLLEASWAAPADAAAARVGLERWRERARELEPALGDRMRSLADDTAG